MNILGDIKGKNLIIVDDLVATASSLVEAAAALKKQGGKEIYAAITHPVLSGPAIKRINDSVIKKLFVTNTIPVENGKRHKKIEVLSIAPLLAEAIKRIHNEESVSCLFN
jgi:ribose-phosphate pyrophosphokinase